MKLDRIYTAWWNLDGSQQLTAMSFDPSGMTDYYGIQAHDVDIEVHEPTRDQAVKAEISSLRVKQGELQHQQDQIEERIKSLLAIEYKGDTV